MSAKKVKKSYYMKVPKCVKCNKCSYNLNEDKICCMCAHGAVIDPLLESVQDWVDLSGFEQNQFLLFPEECTCHSCNSQCPEPVIVCKDCYSYWIDGKRKLGGASLDHCSMCRSDSYDVKDGLCTACYEADYNLHKYINKAAKQETLPDKDQEYIAMILLLEYQTSTHAPSKFKIGEILEKMHNINPDLNIIDDDGRFRKLIILDKKTDPVKVEWYNSIPHLVGWGFYIIGLAWIIKNLI